MIEYVGRKNYYLKRRGDVNLSPVEQRRIIAVAKKVYFPIIEALVSCVRTPVPRRETTVSAHGNESFQPEILAFPATDTGVSI